MLWIKEVEMVDSVGDLKKRRAQFKVILISRILRCQVRGLRLLWTRSSRKFPLQEKGQSGGTEGSERGAVPSRKTDRLHDPRLLPGYWRSWLVLDHADLFTHIRRNDDMLEFDTSWDENLLSVIKIPPDDVLESLYKLRIRESDQIKTVLDLYDMEIHQKISMPNYQILKTMVKRSWIRNQIAKLWRQKWENWNRCSGYESQGSTWCWNRTRRLLSMESERSVFETRQV